MRKLFIVGLLVFILACAQQRPEDIQEVSAVTKYVRSGTQGLQMNFVQDAPPRQIYDNADLVGVLELYNLGNYDLDENKCFIQFGGWDPSIVRGVNVRQICGDLPGKSEFLIDGGYSAVEFKSSNILLPSDVDTFNPDVVATACYEYQTIASPQVCIDPAFFEIAREQRVCDVRDFSLGGGQGAPVAVTFVDVDMVRNRAIFKIDIQNVGGGRVVSPRVSLTQCLSGPKYDEFDQVRYTVSLSSGTMVSCSPQDFLVRMKDGRGKIVCTFDVGNTRAYETPLRIELNYNYMQSIRTPVEIIRTPG